LGPAPVIWAPAFFIAMKWIFEMTSYRLLPLIAAAALCACAGPSDPSKKVASKHCEHATGSLLCTNDDDMPVGDNTAQPSITTPFNGQRGN
jgi:hypothetical protein